MATYAIRELPNLSDPDLVHCCACSQDMRRIVAEQMSHIVAQLDRNPVTIAIRVSLSVLSRTTEGALSIELLCMKNRPRDAAILLLSLYELQLDISYIASDLARAETWVDHAQQNRKPWSVASLQRELFPNPNEFDAERDVYRTYSMIKHCNPQASTLGFGFSVTRDALLIDSAQNDSPLVRTHLFGLAACMSRIGKAASEICDKQGLDRGDFEKRLRDGFETQSKLVEKQIIAVLRNRDSSATNNA